MVNGEKGRYSVGGMVAKLQAVKTAVDAGIATAIINGRQPHRIAAVVAGEEVGTHFVTKRR